MLGASSSGSLEGSSQGLLNSDYQKLGGRVWRRKCRGLWSVVVLVGASDAVSDRWEVLFHFFLHFTEGGVNKL